LLPAKITDANGIEMRLIDYTIWHNEIMPGEKRYVRGHLFIGKYGVVMVRICVTGLPWRTNVAKTQRKYDLSMKNRGRKHDKP
jgi:hypothetical protein